MNYLPLIRKAITALITPVILSLLVPLGIDATTPVADALNIALIALGTAAMVWLIPNKQ